MKIAFGQINPIIGDIKGNKAKIERFYQDAKKENADLVVFPELALVGYPPLDLIEKKEFREALILATNELAAITDAKTALVFGSVSSYSDSVGSGIYNSAFFCLDGKVSFIQNKSLIPNYDVFDEVRYFEPAKSVEIIEFKGVKIGISICEDIWNDSDFWANRRYHIDPIEQLKKLGAELIVNISASPYSYGRREVRRKMLSTLAKNDKVKLAYVCCVGAQTDLIFDGASMYFDENGRLLKLGKVFEEDLFIVDTELQYDEIEIVERSFEEEVIPAIVLGLRDYAFKSGFKKALLGLSGGIDSALVLYFAVKAFGAENVMAVMMPSQYSSKGSIDDSIKLCNNLGIKPIEISIEPVFESIKHQLSILFEGKEEDITEENMQSRIRGLYLMAISNKFGNLLCTTGNKSEIAVGYATLYGDMNGALAVIGDLYKTEVYDVCNFINKDKEIIPIEIIKKAPSAELRPNQTDQDSLPPYEFLDKVLKMYLEENLEINKIVELVDNKEVVRKILRLIDLNEFKRKQAAPVLRISSKAFGYGRRYPMVQKWNRE